MEQLPRRTGTAPWVWVLIVLAALILVFMIWWAVAAQAPETTVVVPEEQPQPPVVQPLLPPTQEQPVIIERERPVNIYIEREQPNPRVIVIPQSQQPPEAKERLSLVNLPSRFRYQGRAWEPSDEAVSGDTINLRDTGASINGNIVYAEQGTEPQYDALYLETKPGSGVYVKYTKTS